MQEGTSEATGNQVKLALANQGCTGEQANSNAAENSIELKVVKLSEAQKSFVLLPLCRVVAYSFGWLKQSGWPGHDFERTPELLARLHFVVFNRFIPPRQAVFLASSDFLTPSDPAKYKNRKSGH